MFPPALFTNPSDPFVVNSNTQILLPSAIYFLSDPCSLLILHDMLIVRLIPIFKP